MYGILLTVLVVILFIVLTGSRNENFSNDYGTKPLTTTFGEPGIYYNAGMDDPPQMLKCPTYPNECTDCCWFQYPPILRENCKSPPNVTSCKQNFEYLLKLWSKFHCQ